MLAGCTPGRTLLGLRLPDRGKNPTPGPACERCARLLKPASAAVPMWNFTVGPTGSGSLLNFASGAGTARSTYLINEPAIIRVPRIGVRFGNRPDAPIVDQLSACDGSGADVKFNSERRDRGTIRTGEWLRMVNSTAKTGPRLLPRAERSAHSSG